MTRTHVAIIAGVALLIGVGLLTGIIVSDSPPKLPSGEPNTVALIAMLLAMVLMAGGLGALLALGIHNRWPKLGGATELDPMPRAVVAMRQGALLAVGVGFVLALQYYHRLDVAYFVVTFLILVLFEAFLQSRT